MNIDQIKAVVRWLLASVSGAVLGWLAAKNILTPDQLQQVASFMTSEAVVTMFVAIATLLWSLFTHTTNSTIKSAANLPQVAKIDLERTDEGKRILEAVGSSPKATVELAQKKQEVRP